MDLDNLQMIAASAAITHKFPPEHLMSLVDKLQTTQEIEAVFRLFADNNLNKFQRSLLDQVIQWCREASPKYERPLSPKQLVALTQQRPTIDRNWKQAKDTRSFQHGLKNPAPAKPDFDDDIP